MSTSIAVNELYRVQKGTAMMANQKNDAPAGGQQLPLAPDLPHLGHEIDAVQVDRRSQLHRRLLDVVFDTKHTRRLKTAALPESSRSTPPFSAWFNSRYSSLFFGYGAAEPLHHLGTNPRHRISPQHPVPRGHIENCASLDNPVLPCSRCRPPQRQFALQIIGTGDQFSFR